jgi:lysophospholipase L1-like esterase
MRQILVYGDSLSWGIVPGTRARHPLEVRWPGVLERRMAAAGQPARVIEDCLNGRRTVWDDPFKPGRNGLQGFEQRIEINSPLALVILMLGNNDFQSMHPHHAWHAAQGVAALVGAIRTAPIEPGMPVPRVLIIASPPVTTPAGAMVDKFRGADEKCRGLAAELEKVAAQEACAFFDAGRVARCSTTDGVHLDAADHLALGEALADFIPALLPPA